MSREPPFSPLRREVSVSRHRTQEDVPDEKQLLENDLRGRLRGNPERPGADVDWFKGKEANAAYRYVQYWYKAMPRDQAKISLRDPADIVRCIEYIWKKMKTGAPGPGPKAETEVHVMGVQEIPPPLPGKLEGQRRAH